ncbi:hypothetical protein EBO15_40835 [Actinomadura harenae]|uniref:Uncharacterized protein n=1 Tax=Actinomadura harenae TaxID=2483351 RepID=A0A3M2LAD8_9ACTN|nr:hypothetical protein EBO15_40835 [Actinomadura harenae]
MAGASDEVRASAQRLPVAWRSASSPRLSPGGQALDAGRMTIDQCTQLTVGLALVLAERR